MSLFKGPEGLQISSTKLRKIKITICRNIPGNSTIDLSTNELQRDIVNPENVVVARRAGEGAKPIFEREELARAGSCTEEVEEYRRVITVKDVNLESKPHKRKSRSISSSPTRAGSHSRRLTPSRNFRGRSRNRSRERKEDSRSTELYNLRDEEERLKGRKSLRYRSRSRDRDSRYGGRSGNRSRERKEDSRSTELYNLRDEEKRLKGRKSRHHRSRSGDRDSRYGGRSGNRSRERKEDSRSTELYNLRDEEKRLKGRKSRHYRSRSGDRDSRYGGRSRNRSREHREDSRNTELYHLRDEEERLKGRKSLRYRSRSRDRDSRYSNKSSRDGSRERRMAVQQIPIPICYDNFPPRPVMIGPSAPVHRQIGYEGYSHPMLPMRPFGPRFRPGIGMFRLPPPQNPRMFGPQLLR